MANANTNLMSVVARPAPAQNSPRNSSVRSPRSGSEQKTSLYQSRGQKNNFRSELDKANAQANSPQQNEELQTVAESAESESVDTLAKTSNQGKKNETQDAPQNPNQHLAAGNFFFAGIESNSKSKSTSTTNPNANSNSTTNGNSRRLADKSRSQSRNSYCSCRAASRKRYPVRNSR